MAFGNNRNQNNKINTTTKVIQMYNPVGDDAGTLTLGFWNQYATIRINPALAKNQQQDGKMYNYDQSASMILGAETIIALNQGIAVMESQIKNKKNVLPVAVRSQNYVLKVGAGGEYEGIDDFYLSIFEVDQSGKATGSMFYPFVAQEGATDNTIMFSWNEDTGKHKPKLVNTQWKAFKTFLKKAEEDLVTAGSHGSTTQLNIWISKLSSAIDVIKGMVEVASFGGKGSGGGNNQGGGNSGSGGMGFSTRRKRNVNLGGGSGDEGNSGGGGGSRNQKRGAKEEKVDNLSDIENEMMDEVGDIEDMD